MLGSFNPAPVLYIIYVHPPSRKEIAVLPGEFVVRLWLQHIRRRLDHTAS
jgi:hypothetical protein